MCTSEVMAKFLDIRPIFRAESEFACNHFVFHVILGENRDFSKLRLKTVNFDISAPRWTRDMILVSRSMFFGTLSRFMILPKRFDGIYRVKIDFYFIFGCTATKRWLMLISQLPDGLKK